MKQRCSLAFVIVLLVAAVLFTTTMYAEVQQVKSKPKQATGKKQPEAQPETKQEFQPVYSFTGMIEVKADSFFDKFPRLTPVTPDNGGEPGEGGVPGEGEEPEESEQEKNDPANWKLKNPTTPSIRQDISLQFYSNPTPATEVFINAELRGLWGGDGTYDYIGKGFATEEAYGRYYTDKAMYTVGFYKYKLGPLGLLVSNHDQAFTGVMLNTMWKKPGFPWYITA